MFNVAIKKPLDYFSQRFAKLSNKSSSSNENVQSEGGQSKREELKTPNVIIEEEEKEVPEGSDDEIVLESEDELRANSVHTNHTFIADSKHKHFLCR